MIAARGIACAHGLHGATFRLDGGFTALVGPNGSGKTTLIKAVAGLLRHRGEIQVEGRISYLPQAHEFQALMPVRDAVALGRAPYRGPLGRLSEQDPAAVTRAMERTDTTHFALRPVGELSGGERARVALARAFATEAPILLADEPTASLDPAQSLRTMQLLKAESETALVLAAVHDLALAATFADRVLVLRDGHLVADGPPAILDGEVVRDVFGISAPQGGWQSAAPVLSGRG